MQRSTDIEKDFEKILRTNLGLPADRSLDHDMPLADYGLDSLTAVNIVVDLEQRFAVTFPDDRIMFAMFHSARTLWDALSELIA
ncbi:acyl carrier protein [Streptomyces canus]|uniref:acyl carrier protein n=1 Tax=Streptomyces canus TaxID=58343 RepID=UPI0037245FEB